jgi:hypothetical protein
VQIGGGVRVGDAFQAIVEFKLIAIWGWLVCVEISQAGRLRLVGFKQERYASDGHDNAEGEARERAGMSGRSGLA